MGFIHPGMLFTLKDLERIKQKVEARESPWIEGWERLKANQYSQLDYSPNFYSIVYRNDNIHSHIGNADLHGSGVAVLYYAIIWYVTKDQAYADRAIAILNGWANTLTDIGGRDRQLAASLYGYELLNGAEIIYHTNAGWCTTEKNRFTKMVEEVFLPITATYGQVNGGWANGNWDAAATLFNMCLAVFTDNEWLYNEAVNYYKTGEGNGSIINYIQTDYGQCQESGRDQAHAQLGIGMLAMAAKIGWNQRCRMPIGEDMAAYPNESYRLLQGIEYTAKYNLGYDVPYEPIPGKGYTLADMAQDVPWRSGLQISQRVRGIFRPIYYLCYGLYVSEIGISPTKLSYTKEVIKCTRLESFFNDHISYGELLFALDETISDLELDIRCMTVLLKNNERYLSVENNRLLLSNLDTDLNDNHIFVLEYQGVKNYFCIKSAKTNKYVTVTAQGEFTFTSETQDKSCWFEMIYTGNGREMFKAYANSGYLTINQETNEIYIDVTVNTSDIHNFQVFYRS